MNFLIIFLFLSTSAFAQTFLDKKCTELVSEKNRIEQDIVDKKAYLNQLQNDYDECTSSKKDIEDAKAVIQAAAAKSEGQNWSDLNAISSNNSSFVSNP